MAHLEGPSPNLQHLDPAYATGTWSRCSPGGHGSAARSQGRGRAARITAMDARAERVGSGWRLNAHKWLIS